MVSLLADQLQIYLCFAQSKPDRFIKDRKVYAMYTDLKNALTQLIRKN